MDRAEAPATLSSSLALVLSRRSRPSSESEAEVVASMRKWSVDMTGVCSPETLVAALFGYANGGDCNESIAEHDCAVGLAWPNPLTDADIVLTIPLGLSAEIRDHDGDGEDLMPWWFHDALSGGDATTKSVIIDAVDCFIGECRDALDKYKWRVSSRPGWVGAADFRKTVDTELQMLKKPKADTMD